MTNRRWLAVALTLVVIGATISAGATAAIRDEPAPVEVPQLTQADFENTLEAFTYLRDEAVNVVPADAILQGGWDAARKAANLEADSYPRPSQPRASDALRAELTYVIEHNQGRESTAKVVEAFISGMAAALHDPHTVFLPGSALRDTASDDEDEAGDVFYGMSAEETPEGDRIWEVLPGSPAERTGLKTGDLVLHSELLTTGDDPRERIRSYALRLSVRRGGRTFSFVVRPTVEKLPTAAGRPLDDGIDYLRIYSFSRSAADFDAALDAAWDQLRGDRLVVDLRTNNGGAIRNLAALAGKLGYRGTMFISVDRNGRRSSTTAAHSVSSPYQPAQIIFLVNGGSYSGAELLPAFAQQFPGTRVVGTQTTGTSHAAIAVRIGKGVLELGLYRNLIGPKQIDIEGKGVVPDETVELDYGRIRKGEDNVIERAVELFSSTRP